MGKQKKRYVGKVGYCDNVHLNINKPAGHYVYISKYNGNKCDVHTITSLEDDKRKLNKKRIAHVRKGNIYPIPKYDTNLPKWSGITKHPIKNVELSKIQDIGKIKIKQRHSIMKKYFGN
ncbi:MAG: hypothetical protein J6A95_06150 [Clostridia bacterium]|nr:hypothetical protein [Clostridia bacterium]